MCLKNFTVVGEWILRNLQIYTSIVRNTNRPKQLNRTQFHEFFVTYPSIKVVMETCGTTHYWARTLTKMGQQVSLLPAQYVKPYVRRNKLITMIQWRL